jgi:DNA-binding transcriptional ArsR family regulator
MSEFAPGITGAAMPFNVPLARHRRYERIVYEVKPSSSGPDLGFARRCALSLEGDTVMNMSDPLPLGLLEPIAARFRVLGDATRLAILRTLLHHGRPLNVGELVAQLDMSQANISKHLRTLHDAGLVSRQARGTAAYYAVADPSISQLCEIVCGRLREQVSRQAEAFAST